MHPLDITIQRTLAMRIAALEGENAQLKALLKTVREELAAAAAKEQAAEKPAIEG